MEISQFVPTRKPEYKKTDKTNSVIFREPMDLRGNIGQKKSLKNFFESYYFWNSFWQRRALQLVIIKKTTMILLYTGHHTLLDYWLDLGLFTLY